MYFFLCLANEIKEMGTVWGLVGDFEVKETTEFELLAISSDVLAWSEGEVGVAGLVNV